MTLLFCIILVGVFANYNKKDFKLVNLSKINRSEWSKLNRSKGVLVENNNGNIIFKEGEYNNPNSVVFSLEDGRLEAKDKGEWGGTLTFISKNDEKKVLIKQGNVKFIFELNGKIYFIEGLAHVDVNEGALYELKRVNSGFEYDKILEFEDAPETYMIYKDEIFVAGYENFYVIDKLNKKIILEKTFWSGLYPTSLATLDGKNIYIGMRGGYALVNIQNKKIDFYKLNQ